MKKLLLAVALSLLPVAGLAQSVELRSISEYLKLPENRRDTAYPFIRCVGLFQGLYRYGSVNFSDSDAARTQAGNEAMSLMALLLRQQKHPDIELDALATQLGSEIEELTAVYSERMRRNYSLKGEAWGSDQIIMDDFQTCGDIVRASLDRAEGFN